MTPNSRFNYLSRQIEPKTQAQLDKLHSDFHDIAIQVNSICEQLEGRIASHVFWEFCYTIFAFANKHHDRASNEE